MTKTLNTAAFFDSSVLVPLLYSRHTHHQKAEEFVFDYLKQKLVINISSQNILEISLTLNRAYKVALNNVSRLLENFLDDPLVNVVYPNAEVVNRYLSFLKSQDLTYIVQMFFWRSRHWKMVLTQS